MEVQKKSKKKVVIVLSIILAVVVVMAVVLAVLIPNLGALPDAAQGTWAVVYRYVDKDGNKYNDYVSDEFVKVTKNQFTYYRVAKDDSLETLVDTKLKYVVGTSQNDNELREINKVANVQISLGDYKDVEFGFAFYGVDCMLFESSGKPYAIFVRCPDIGVVPSFADSMDGKWKWKNSFYNLNISGETMTIDFSNRTLYYSKSFENGHMVFEFKYEETDDGQRIPADENPNKYVVLFASPKYLVLFNREECGVAIKVE